MRILASCLIAALLATSARAAEKVLIDEYDTWNLYTRLDLKHSDLGADSGWIGGVQVGGLLNEKLGVGVAAYSNLQDLDAAPTGYKNLQSFDLFYGGAMTEYRLLSDKVFHLSVGVFAGVGRLNLERAASKDDDEIRFNVIEPHANVVLHITSDIDLGLGIGYRWLNLRRDVSGYENDPFHSVVTTVFLRFTEF